MNTQHTDATVHYSVRHCYNAQVRADLSTAGQPYGRTDGRTESNARGGPHEGSLYRGSKLECLRAWSYTASQTAASQLTEATDTYKPELKNYNVDVEDQYWAIKICQVSYKSVLGMSRHKTSGCSWCVSNSTVCVFLFLSVLFWTDMIKLYVSLAWRVAVSSRLRVVDPVKKGKGSPYSITEHRVPELISWSACRRLSHKPDGRLQLLSDRPAESCYQFCCLVNRGTMGVNSLPKTVTRQRHDCDLNPGPSAPESSTLTTRLPSHPYINI